MCGIVGYTGDDDFGEVITDSLSKLEYRGYDSAGVAFIDNARKLNVTKNIGHVSKIAIAQKWKQIKSTTGIGHTRWATHGIVNDINAHPHLSNDGKIAVVHNGIIENHVELKEFLIEQGFKFFSDTDSEIIPNLIQYYNRPEDAHVTSAFKAINRLKGIYSILVLFEDTNMILGVKNKLPLMLSTYNQKIMFASDCFALENEAKNIYRLKDREMVLISEKLANPYRATYDNDILELEVINPDEFINIAENISSLYIKDDNIHFTLKEIMDQPYSLNQCFNENVEYIHNLNPILNKFDNVVFTGCGSSFHACIFAKYIFANTFKHNVKSIVASEMEYFRECLSKNTLLIALSQSGETADTLMAIEVAKDEGAQVLGIINREHTVMHDYCDYILHLCVGPEISVLSTKTYTAQILLLNLLKLTLDNQLNLFDIDRLSDSVLDIVSHEMQSRIRYFAHSIQDEKSILCVGKGMAYPTALEAALKIKEASYIHAEGVSSAELKHGSLSLVKQDYPIIGFVTADSQNTRLSLREAQTRGAKVIAVGPKYRKEFNYWITTPDIPYGNNILQIIPMQLMAYFLACINDINPDKPRNLAKSVTVN